MKKNIPLSILFTSLLALTIGVVSAYTFSAEPWTQGEWSAYSVSSQADQTKLWVESNYAKRNEFTQTPWELADWNTRTREEKVDEQKRFQYLSWRVHKNFPITFSTRNKKIININESRAYFIPNKTEAEWTSFKTAVEGGQVPDLSLVNAGCTYDSQDYDVDEVWTTSAACVYTTNYTYGCNYQCDTCSVKDYIACSVNCSYSFHHKCSSGCGSSHCNNGGDCRDWWVYKNVSCNCGNRSTCTGTTNHNGNIITTHTCNADTNVTDVVGACG